MTSRVMSKGKPRICVVGGGLSGLSTAYLIMEDARAEGGELPAMAGGLGDFLVGESFIFNIDRKDTKPPLCVLRLDAGVVGENLR